MTEFELKLEVPPQRREEVALAFGTAPRKRLQAMYFDTGERALARARVVVRLRKEGSRWVQTAKASSGNALERLEHNVDLPRQPAGQVPALELQWHADTPLETRLRTALDLRQSDPFPALSLVFETDVYRQVQEVKAGRSVVELAFDRGRVTAGNSQAGLCELEFELKSGRPQDAIRLAKTWCTRHHLWISTVSKSLKGLRLAEGTPPAAVAAQPLAHGGKPSSRAVTGMMVLNCLDHVLPNASDIAAGSTGRDQIHQLRVGLRRLRTVLRELEGPAGKVRAAQEARLATVFRILGNHRDREYLAEKQQPVLQAAGGPALDTAQGAGPLPDPGEAVRSSPFQIALLDLLAFGHVQASSAPDQDKPAKRLLRSRLGRLHKRLLKDAPEFLGLDEESQHATRKRLKRLRYLAELATPLYGKKKTSRFLQGLKPVQDSLGEYNDGLMALAGYRKLSASDPGAWFGVGWLSAMRQFNATACRDDLNTLKKLKPFW